MKAIIWMGASRDASLFLPGAGVMQAISSTGSSVVPRDTPEAIYCPPLLSKEDSEDVEER
jgi:hypothetical protein